MASSPPVFIGLKTSRRSRLIDLREKVEPVLRNRIHSHFTDHSVAHSDRVAAIARQLSAPLKGAQRLNGDEAFVLFASCYLHDVGMHNETAGIFGRLAARLRAVKRDWSEVERDERLDFIRRYHHEISADMVSGSVRSVAPSIGLSLLEDDLPSEIASICEAHCVDTNSSRYVELTQAGERPGMRLRLLSSLLRLADILDEANHRALVEQARTLDLNLESRMHWWRHYYTREISVESANNRITVWFDFPLAQKDEYAEIIPPLQMPLAEAELARHREVLAENGLGWHLGWQVQQNAFSSLSAMPTDVKGLMLRELARRRQTAADTSRLDVLRHFDQHRDHISSEFDELDARRIAETSDEYLLDALRLAKDLWEIGSHTSAWHRLRSAMYFATTNGRAVAPKVRVKVAYELGGMLAEDGQLADSLRALIDARQLANDLPDPVPAKAEFYRYLACVALRAGYAIDGLDAVKQAMALLPNCHARDALVAELAESRLLTGEGLEEVMEVVNEQKSRS